MAFSSIVRMAALARDCGEEGGEEEEGSSGVLERELMCSRMSIERGMERAERISLNM
jgi:hypothetical protein